MTETQCTGTEATEITEALAAELVAEGWSYNGEVSIHGREVCATCEGLVNAKRDGSLVRHRPGSNRA